MQPGDLDLVQPRGRAARRRHLVRRRDGAARSAVRSAASPRLGPDADGDASRATASTRSTSTSTSTRTASPAPARPATVPGRGVTVDRKFAWEKAIVLTPRPDIARTMLQMYFDDVFEAELRAEQGTRHRGRRRHACRRDPRREVDDLYLLPDQGARERAPHRVPGADASSSAACRRSRGATRRS